MIPVVLYAAEYSLDDLYRIALKRAEKIKLSEEDLYIAKTGMLECSIFETMVLSILFVD